MAMSKYTLPKVTADPGPPKEAEVTDEMKGGGEATKEVRPGTTLPGFLDQNGRAPQVPHAHEEWGMRLLRQNFDEAMRLENARAEKLRAVQADAFRRAQPAGPAKAPWSYVDRMRAAGAKVEVRVNGRQHDARTYALIDAQAKYQADLERAEAIKRHNAAFKPPEE